MRRRRRGARRPQSVERFLRQSAGSTRAQTVAGKEAFLGGLGSGRCSQMAGAQTAACSQIGELLAGGRRQTHPSRVLVCVTVPYCYAQLLVHSLALERRTPL
jgi:hypothetical protein